MTSIDITSQLTDGSTWQVTKKENSNRPIFVTYFVVLVCFALAGKPDIQGLLFSLVVTCQVL